jgi:hypothetical protein
MCDIDGGWRRRSVVACVVVEAVVLAVLVVGGFGRGLGWW